MKSYIVPILGIFSAACASVEPVPTPVVRTALDVSAPFERTWNAVIDHFAESNIAIATMEKASGFVAAHRVSVSDREARLAHCGHDGWDRAVGPEYAIYNVLVRGDQSKSTVQVTVRWEFAGKACATRGTWETAFERAVKERAERLTGS